MRILAKALVISLLAGVLAALPFAVLFAIGMEASLAMFAGFRYLAFGIAVSVVIGLPIGVLIFQLIKNDQSFDRSRLFLVANGAAFVLTTILGVFSGWFGVFFLGLPTFLAANVYAIAGWRMILRDYRGDRFA